MRVGLTVTFCRILSSSVPALVSNEIWHRRLGQDPRVPAGPMEVAPLFGAHAREAS